MAETTASVNAARASRNSASRRSVTSRTPPFSPARTMLIYRRENGRGWWRARASLNEAPPRTVRSRSAMTDFTRGVAASSSRTASARSRGRPASKSVASCCVKVRRSRCRRRPVVPRRHQGARSVWETIRIGKYASRCRRSATARTSGASMTPSTVLPPRSAARYVKTGMGRLGFLLGDPKDFRDGRETGPRLRPAILPERHHAVLGGGRTMLAERRLAQDEAPDVLADREQLIDAEAPAVAGAAALRAAPAVEERLPPFPGGQPERDEVARLRLVGRAAAGADSPDEPLGEHALEHRGDEVGLAAHVLQPRDGARRVVRVQGREDEVSGEGGLDRDLGRLEVADLADHDDVGILAHDVPEPRGEGEAELRLHP